MGRMATPSLYPGERSLPAELRTPSGSNFAQRRLAASLQPSASPTSWNQMRLRGLMGVHGLGQTCTGYDEDGNCDSWDSTTTGPTQPVSLPTPIISNPVDTNTGVNLSSVFSNLGVDPTTAQYAAPYATAPSGYTGATVVAPTAATPAAPSGYQWAQLVNSEGNTLAKVLTIAQGGSSVTLPNGTQLLYGSSTAAANATGVLGALSTVTGLNSSTLLLVGAGVLVFFLMEGRK